MAYTTTVTTAFAPMDIKNGSFKFLKDTSGSQVAIGCTGLLTGETEVATIQQKCGRAVMKSKSKPIAHTVTLKGNFKSEFIARLYGLSAEGLKTGVLSYGPGAVGENFLATFDVVDDLNDVIKKVAYPDLAVISGYAYNYDAATDTYEGVELQLAANTDDSGQWMYEAYEADLDTTTKQSWHTAFTRTLVAAVTP